jgi:hypothetical protein
MHAFSQHRRQIDMCSFTKSVFAVCLLVSAAFAQQIPHDDEVRIAEGFRLAHQIQDKIWPGWSNAPFPVLLVTADGEFLINHPKQPEGFTKAGHSDRLDSDIYFRPRKFQLNSLATFPALGDGIPVIVIGEPQNTGAKTSTPWVITFLHEHFHQLQYSQPDYQAEVAKLDLAKGDTTGMWMLNFRFPYDQPEVVDGFNRVKAALLEALHESDKKRFKTKSAVYLAERKKFIGSLKADDRRYFEFQVWQEGLARYTQIKAAEAAASYQPTDDFKRLKDYESFADYAKRARTDTENELSQADIAKWQRVVFYPYGACEGLLLDRLNPKWQSVYFKDRFSTDTYFGKSD